MHVRYVSGWLIRVWITTVSQTKLLPHGNSTIIVSSCSNVIPLLHAAVKLSTFSCLTIPETVYSSLLITTDGQSSSIAYPIGLEQGYFSGEAIKVHMYVVVSLGFSLPSREYFTPLNYTAILYIGWSYPTLRQKTKTSKSAPMDYIYTHSYLIIHFYCICPISTYTVT